MLLDVFPVGPIQANCVLLGDPDAGLLAVIDPGAEAARILEARGDVAGEFRARGGLFDLLEEQGRLDVLVNNAALYTGLKGARFEQLEEGQWDAVMNINVKGLWQCCKAVVAPMRAFCAMASNSAWRTSGRRRSISAGNPTETSSGRGTIPWEPSSMSSTVPGCCASRVDSALRACLSVDSRSGIVA